MNLQELIDSIMALPYVLHYIKEAEYFGGSEQIYRFWYTQENIIRNIPVKILVTDFGVPEEVAVLYNPDLLSGPVTAFYDEIMAALPAWLAAHPDVEKYTIESCNEMQEIAIFTIFVNIGSEIVTEKRLIVFKIGSTITVRELEKQYSIDTISDGLSMVIEHGIGAI